MYRGLQAKVRIMKQYPNMGAFALKAYYEKDPAVCADIQKSFAERAAFKTNRNLLHLDPEQFLPGLDLEMMYRNMYWASEGYILEKLKQGGIDAEQMEADFMQLIEFWKQIYLRKEG